MRGCDYRIFVCAVGLVVRGTPIVHCRSFYSVESLCRSRSVQAFFISSAFDMRFDNPLSPACPRARTCATCPETGVHVDRGRQGILRAEWGTASSHCYAGTLCFVMAPIYLDSFLFLLVMEYTAAHVPRPQTIRQIHPYHPLVANFA